MKAIKLKEAVSGANSENCNVLEYSFNDKDIDLGIATITGRYPDDGYSVNIISKALIYVLDGSGKLYVEDECIEFKKGDSILIDKNEKYYWDSSYCIVSMICTPAWSKAQYQLVEN